MSLDQYKTCYRCNTEQAVEKFITGLNRKNIKFYKNLCKLCFNQARRNQRKNIDLIGRIILYDSRNSDKKKGLENDLTIDFIQLLIDKGCSYCDEKNLRMTLDRINNDLGHLQNNVIPACIRCNYIRKNMPYEAWLVVSKGVKKANAKKLFKNWIGGTKNNKHKGRE